MDTNERIPHIPAKDEIMPFRIIFGLGVVFTFFLCVTSSPLAEGEVSPVEVKIHNGIKYMSGGFGYDERDALRKRGKNFSLKAMFSEKGGDYMSNVQVQIQNAAGQNILQAVSDGPWFFAGLPAGRYTVIVEARGRTLSKTAHITRGTQKTLHFVW